MKKTLLLSTFLGLIGVGACSAPLHFHDRHGIAHRIASPSHMTQRTLHAEPFALTTFERVHDRGGAVNVYIEGDGLAWMSKRKWSMDPTPIDPHALRLAAEDDASNVIYMARPCQYSKLIVNDKPCDPVFWTGERYSPTVLASYQQALDTLKSMYSFSEFHLIGYSGGGTIATLLAATRDDIATLRTVAGNLDHIAHSTVHNVSILPGSLNPIDYAPTLRDVPQIHYIGGKDEIVPSVIYDSYALALGPTPCLGHAYVPNATHTEGWTAIWKDAVRATTPTCDHSE